MKDNIVYYLIVNKKDIRNNEVKNQTDMALLILKEMLDYFNIDMPKIEISSTGKPFFKNSNIFFNYSHSKNYIACVISLEDVGIDIEETNRIISDDIATKYLDSEKENIKRIEIWVRKEAYSKLEGLGLQINFRNINLSNIKNKSIIISNSSYICSIYSNYEKALFEELKI